MRSAKITPRRLTPWRLSRVSMSARREFLLGVCEQPPTRPPIGVRGGLFLFGDDLTLPCIRGLQSHKRVILRGVGAYLRAVRQPDSERCAAAGDPPSRRARAATVTAHRLNPFSLECCHEHRRLFGPKLLVEQGERQA